MTSGVTESIIEQAALAWLESAGWSVRNGAEIAPGEPAAERGDYGQVVLEQRLRDALAPEVLESLSKPEQEGWQWMSTKGRAKSSQYAKAMRIEDRTARRHLNRFEKLGLVRKTGSGPSTEYEVI
jgi:hypothetical protein